MSNQYLMQRGKSWSFQIAVPPDLLGNFTSSTGTPLRNIVVALGTDSLNEARLKRDKLLIEWRATFDRARKGLELSVGEIEEQAAEIYHSKLEAMAEAARRGMAPQVDTGEDDSSQEREIAALDIALNEYLEATSESDFSVNGHCPIAADLATVQRRTKIALASGGKTERLVSRALLEANIAALTGRMRMLRGEASEAPSSFLGSDGIDPVLLRPVVRKVVSATPHAIRFAEATELWLADLQRDPKAKPREHTIWLYSTICAKFAKAEHNPPLEAVTRKVAADFLAKIGKERELSNRTLKQYATTLGKPFKFARRIGRFDGDSPFDDQSYREPQDTGYLPFPDADLKKLFTGPIFADKPFSDPLAWVSLIGLYAGMRLNEIGQLWAHDIKQEHGIWIFDVQEGEGQKLKTKAATRKVPIHSQLIKAGFLKYVQSLKRGSRLFPTLRAAGLDKKFSRNLSIRFLKYRTKVGITGDRLCFHSLRKNFGTALDKAGIPPTDREALLGHSRGFSLDTYSTGPGLKRLKDMVEAIRYPIIPHVKD